MSIRTLLLLSTVAIAAVGCSEESPTAPPPVTPTPDPDPDPVPLPVPATYNFDSRFNTKVAIRRHRFRQHKRLFNSDIGVKKAPVAFLRSARGL